MSEGKRSGVNWTRLKDASIDLAMALAKVVLPTPGISSMRTDPPEIRARTRISIVLSFPRMT